jgi:hypothetical protein
MEEEVADRMGKLFTAYSIIESIRLYSYYSYYSNTTATGLEMVQGAERVDTK